MWKTDYVDTSILNKSKDAMLFHFDCDHNRFLKVFMYLNDVGADNGPHVYVPNTSVEYRAKLPDCIQKDGRLNSIEVINSGLIPNYIEGPGGTMIFADTSSLHKEEHQLKKGHPRYILQIQYVDSLAGARLAHTRKELIEMNPGIC